MKKNNTKKLIILVLIIVIVFFMLPILRNQGPNQDEQMNMQMRRPVKVDYQKVDSNTLYTERIFDNSYMHEINIIISKSDIEDLINDAIAKKKYKVDVIIDGEKIKNVSIKTKGNSSLKNIAEAPMKGPASNRYSFKIDFSKYEKDQTYFGLDKINLNNIYGDASYINDYISYMLFNKMNVPAPLSSFAYVKVNGNNFGLYSIVEEVGNSFFKRNYLDGYLYKPEQAYGRDLGSSLQYVDDKFSSYTDIFNNAESFITDEDKIRLINSIKQLNQMNDLENVLYTDEIIKYFVVHNFLLSYDSYTGKSIHNYYLLENNSKLFIIPWDYNLAFGRFNIGNDINTIINYGIDSPLSNVTTPRPLWNWIISNPLYLEKYHKTMNEFIKEYFETGKIDEYIDEIYNVISPYISLDISAFYSKNQVDKAINTLKKFCKYRSQSIRLQLDGKLSSISSNQKKSSSVDASSIDINDLGLVADDSKRNEENQNKKNSHSH